MGEEANHQETNGLLNGGAPRVEFAQPSTASASSSDQANVTIYPELEVPPGNSDHGSPVTDASCQGLQSPDGGRELAIRLQGAYKHYGKGGKRTPVLLGLDMEVKRGEIYGLLGKKFYSMI